MITENIVLRPVKADNIIVPNRKAVVDTISNRVLGIVSNRYKVVKNDDLLKVVTPLATELGMNSTPQIISSRGGSITLFKFLGERNLTKEIQKGDLVQFGIEFFNSYSGSMPLGFHIIALRLVCTNGLVVPRSIRRLTIKHIGDASPNLVKKEVESYFGKTKEAISTWTRWSEVRPEMNRVKTFLSHSVGKRLQKNLSERYINLPEQDRTIWGLYNILTAYITHDIKTRTQDIKGLRQFRLGERFSNGLSKFFEPEVNNVSNKN